MKRVSAGTADNDDDDDGESPYEWMNFKDLTGKYDWYYKEEIFNNIPRSDKKIHSKLCITW